LCNLNKQQSRKTQKGYESGTLKTDWNTWNLRWQLIWDVCYTTTGLIYVFVS